MSGTWLVILWDGLQAVRVVRGGRSVLEWWPEGEVEARRAELKQAAALEDAGWVQDMGDKWTLRGTKHHDLSTADAYGVMSHGL